MTAKHLPGLIAVFLLLSSPLPAQTRLKVGGEKFNEGYILSEMIAQLLEDAGFQIDRVFGLGGTSVGFGALRSGAIDVYPVYSGTLSRKLLHEDIDDLSVLNRIVHERFGLEISAPYGFNNTWVLGVTPATANRRRLKRISDLQEHPDMKFGFTHEFLDRADGWPGLSKRYGLTNSVLGLEHSLSYQALLDGKIDLTDAYSTDGELAKYKLVTLEDDLHFFPKYEAVSFFRASLPARAKAALKKLEGAISETTMRALNAEALFENRTHSDIARRFLAEHKLVENRSVQSKSRAREIWEHALVHLRLTLVSLVAAIVIAVPLGILLYRYGRLARPLLYLTGILQTIPSIALLALMIPFLGIGALPAVAALFLYALLPILRNTVIGFAAVDPTLKKIATAIGLDTVQRLRYVEIPLAAPMILTGIRTAAVINVGTATLSAFIGAGGLGEFIVTGLAVNSKSLILMGAIPSALLAVLMELCFEGLERWLFPRHLRQQTF